MSEIEKGINFKVDEELYKRIKIEIAQKGISLKEYITNLIIKDLEKK